MLGIKVNRNVIVRIILYIVKLVSEIDGITLLEQHIAIAEHTFLSRILPRAVTEVWLGLTP